MSIARYKKQGSLYLVEMFGVVRGRMIGLGRFTVETEEEMKLATEFCTHVLRGG